MKVQIMDELREIGRGLELSGDARFNSPGHCAKYGCYSLRENRVNKVLDVQLVQVAVILEEELLHKNVLQDVKRLNRPSYCQPGDFSQFCQSLCDQTHPDGIFNWR
ncbi:hypothetical protein LSAT2_029840 [Lamellibrachia satsuma]|nr:hypothetical protein LSAT2_029840 [Lamellibrachia satsuma]